VDRLDKAGDGLNSVLWDIREKVWLQPWRHVTKIQWEVQEVKGLMKTKATRRENRYFAITCSRFETMLLKHAIRGQIGATLKKMLRVYDFLLCAPFVAKKGKCSNSMLLSRERRHRNELSACCTCNTHCHNRQQISVLWTANGWQKKNREKKKQQQQCEKSTAHFVVS